MSFHPLNTGNAFLKSSRGAPLFLPRRRAPSGCSQWALQSPRGPPTPIQPCYFPTDAIRAAPEPSLWESWTGSWGSSGRWPWFPSHPVKEVPHTGCLDSQLLWNFIKTTLLWLAYSYVTLHRTQLWTKMELEREAKLVENCSYSESPPSATRRYEAKEESKVGGKNPIHKTRTTLPVTSLHYLLIEWGRQSQK